MNPEEPAVTPADDQADALARTVSAHVRALRWADAHHAVGHFLGHQPDSPRALALAGEIFREEWKLDDARRVFERALALDPVNAEARAGLAFVQIVTGGIDEGITNCRWAIGVRSDLAAAHRHLASALIIKGKAGDAAHHALEARRLAPLQPENTIVLAAAWFRAGLRAGAMRLIDRVIAQHPKRAEAWTTRAAFRYAFDGAAAAEADLAHALALKPWLPPAHALMARLHIRAGRVDEAMAAIGRARQGNPASEEYLLLQAMWLAAVGRRSVALDGCRANWWRHPKSRELKCRIATWLLEEGDIREARRYISGVRADAPASALRRRLGDIWMELGGDFAHEALACYRAAAKDDSDPALAMAVADLLSHTGRMAEALERADAIESPKAAALAAECEDRLDRADAALARLEQAAARYPDDGLVAMRLGMALRVRSRFDEAEPHARRAVALAPFEPAAAEQLAVLLSDREAFDESLALFRRAAELSFDANAVRFNIGILLARQRRWSDAEQVFRQVIAADPLHVNAAAKLVHLLVQQKRWAEAIEWLEPTIERAPAETALRDMLVFANRSLHRIDAAVTAAGRWVEDAPDAFAAVAMLARQLAASHHADADNTADRAWALSPGTVAAMEMRADVAAQLGRYREAADWLERALAIEPDNISLLTYRGFVVQEFDAPSAAEAMLRRVLAVAPDAGHAPMNLALLGLRQGAYDEGWRLYESRDSALKGPATLIAAREHTGGTLDLTKASVYVRGEQGLGDILQFMRYVTRLAAECREVIFQMPESIMWTARQLAPNVRVFGYDEQVPPSDFQTALLSLPRYYGTTLGSIPATVPYVEADSDRVAEWRARIGGDGFKIGLVWQTDPAHGNARRWIPLRHLAPLADIPGVRLISLQKFHGLDQISTVRSGTVETLGDHFDEGPDAFADTAAVMNVLDLVIAIDTSVAHLAAAMGRPTWVLLMRSADWRWLSDREDSPWYPTVRLVRQHVADDWEDVSRRLVDRCRAVMSGSSSALWPV